MDNKAFISALAILLLTLGITGAIAKRGVPSVVATNLEKLPMEIMGMRGTEDSFDEAIYQELNADRHVYRHFRDEEGRQVSLYIGYYGTAKGGRTPHNPYACLPAAGWGITKTNMVQLKPNYYPDGVKVNYILAQKGDLYETVLHWYQASGDKVLASGLQQNIQRLISRVTRNRNDGAFVRVSIFSQEEDVSAALGLAGTFAENILDLLPGYWPVEQ